LWVHIERWRLQWGVNVKAYANKMLERRKHRRCKVQEGAFAVLRPQWPYSTKIGQIIDVSIRGLAFCYIDTEEEMRGPCELDILLSGREFYLHQIPFKDISDIEMHNETPFSSIRTRRCGLQFGELMPSQMNDLKYFIENYTIGQV
jgi:hypothetical protein